MCQPKGSKRITPHLLRSPRSFRSCHHLHYRLQFLLMHLALCRCQRPARSASSAKLWRHFCRTSRLTPLTCCCTGGKPWRKKRSWSPTSLPRRLTTLKRTKPLRGCSNSLLPTQRPSPRLSLYSSLRRSVTLICRTHLVTRAPSSFLLVQTQSLRGS
eukprot:Mycagemm_TRINITY_DN10153_c0_g6::TRINITY_DN10153_c0_g6_i1::g.5126::m.5126 type:complete len:157 gc:universal TRINITY_DN10153_c0_g6_i1:523-53(-)